MKNKIILIIGGSGSWGEALIRNLLLEDVSKIKVFARNESKLVNLKMRFPDTRVEIHVGDVRDQKRLLEVCNGCHIIFHLAALKHVPVCEGAPTEAILTNVTGTANVVQCALKTGVEKVVYSSTDKAVSPHCTYGCSKLLGEKLMLSANNTSQGTDFIVFRCGNLFGSEGSVLPVFERQIALNKEITLTHELMSRFFIPIEEAAQLLITIGKIGKGGEIFLPKMPALWISDIAKYLLELNSLNPKSMRIIGPRPGEKFNELLATSEEQEYIFYVSPTLSVVLKAECSPELKNLYSEKEKNFPLDSQKSLISYEQVCEFMKKVYLGEKV